MTFDFSEFHPLDHGVLDPECGRMPGGRRAHLRLWWRYQLDLVGPVRRVVYCPRGHHRPTPYWVGGTNLIEGNLGETPDGYDCQDCGEPL